MTLKNISSSLLGNSTLFRILGSIYSIFLKTWKSYTNRSKMCPCTFWTHGRLLFCRLHSRNECLSSPCSLVMFVEFPFHCSSASHGFWISISSHLDSQGLAYFPFFKVSIFIAGIYTKRKLTSGNPEEGLHEQFLHHRLVNWRPEEGIYDQKNSKSVFWEKEKKKSSF